MAIAQLIPNSALASAALFPILPNGPKGLVRMAAEAEHVGDGHLVEFRSMQVRSVLNKTVSKRLPWLGYSINPYRGCEFGCKYCYARYTHEFLAPKAGPSNAVPSEDASDALRAGSLSAPDAFERIIFMKRNAAWLLEQDLKKIDPAQEIALGTATDPYQPIERTACITRSLLEVFARRQGYRLGIVTKSTLIERDIDLLVEIARRNKLRVHLTVTAADAKLARKLEPRAPRPDLRLATVSRLSEAGIATGVLCCPLLPGITDTPRAIDGMARRAAAAGASSFAANPLFLKPCSRPTYLQFVREHFPALVGEYERRYGTADFVSRAYREKLEKIVAEACERHGLRKRRYDSLVTRDTGFDGEIGVEERKRTASVPVECQQRLFA